MPIQERFVKSRVKLLRESPFFGTLLLNTKYRVTDDVPTAATDGQTLLLNEEFMEAQTQPHFQSILLHEMLHMALEHIERMKDVFMTDPQIANIAADIVVNGIIRDNGMSLPDDAVYDDELKKLSVREIYNIIKQKQQKDKNYVENKYGTGVNECLMKPNGHGGSGDPTWASEKGAPGSTRSVNWKDVLNKAATIARAKSAGVRGAGLARVLGELLEPTIDWRHVLYRYITASRTDFEGYDRRFVHTGAYLDDLGGEKINVQVYVDTSGSVDEKLLREFFSEIQFAINAMPQISGELSYFDVDVYPQGDIREMVEAPKPVGGGGTSFEAILKHLGKAAEEAGASSQTLGIIFTDGYAPLSSLLEPETASVLWCVSPGGVEDERFPFGEVCRILR